MATIIVSAPLPGPALPKLSSEHNVIVGSSPYGLGHDGLMERLRATPSTTAMITLLSDTVDRDLLNAGRSLRIVANCAVGVDNLDLQELRDRGIVAANTPGVLTEATADLTMALMLDACRNVTRGDRLVREGRWQGWSPTLLVGPQVTGATLGIVGFGRIGQAVAQRAQGFSMRVLYTQHKRVDPQTERSINATFAPLDELLAQSDIVSLHCPLTASTRGLLNETRMRQMRAGSVLVNCSRGPCVDENALARLLAEGHIAAAGLDVYEREPEVCSSLLVLPNVVLAPHIGSADTPTRERMAGMCVDAIVDVLAGRIPTNRVV